MITSRCGLRTVLATAVVAALTAGCSPGDAGSQASPNAASPSLTSAAPGATPASPAGAPAAADDVAVARGLVDALNRGDGTAARGFFSPTARFDSVGRVYPDRDAIFSRFIDPEVIALGGRYAERSTRTDGDRLVVEYDFTTRGGGSEHFTYAYRIVDGLITDVVGRYV